ncbi:hypothetical protein NPIL_111201 [Nephila pilipes]|uniref:Uncharacterized protein n=1 Tax=Nephila pilipes TaxID=299642 RepID=A0A8X6UM05_NEPPI|nr:hypothetical protein NPIL_116601 [Nephila pilipes]GFU35958.1 hypothetical protein NPIL_111201 [Nephila pilipes]
MKVLAVTLMLLACLALGEAKRCRSAQDCDDDECCVARGIFGIRHGRCQKLAKKGEPFMASLLSQDLPALNGVLLEE